MKFEDLVVGDRIILTVGGDERRCIVTKRRWRLGGALTIGAVYDPGPGSVTFTKNDYLAMTKQDRPKLVTLHETPLFDIPGMLRKFADAIEAGKHGDVKMVAAVLVREDLGMSTFAWPRERRRQRAGRVMIDWSDRPQRIQWFQDGFRLEPDILQYLPLPILAIDGLTEGIVRALAQLDESELRRMLGRWISELEPEVVCMGTGILVGLTARGHGLFDPLPIYVRSSLEYTLTRAAVFT